MREFLFRGKRVDKDEWIEGMPCSDYRGSIDAIQGFNGRIYDIIPETFGQYTGLTDKNGKKIFEGDIIECKWFNAMVRIEHRKHLVIFLNGSFCAEWYIGQDNYNNALHNTFDRKVIGNIHDNPDTLEVIE